MIQLSNLITENSEENLNTPDGTRIFTEDDLDVCWPHYKSYLIDILNGEYSVEEARDDLKGLIGSKWDTRVNNHINRNDENNNGS